MTLLIFANDFVTMSLATDNVSHTANPNKWNVKNITFVSLMVGALLVLEGAIAFFVGSHYFHLQLPQLQTFTVLMLIFTSQFRVYIVRERKYFWSAPSRQGISYQYNCGTSCVFIAWGIWADYPGDSSLSGSFCPVLFSSVYTCNRLS
jgi:magnesium-transporting ATPase (P-type)